MSGARKAAPPAGADGAGEGLAGWSRWQEGGLFPAFLIPKSVLPHLDPRECPCNRLRVLNCYTYNPRVKFLKMCVCVCVYTLLFHLNCLDARDLCSGEQSQKEVDLRKFRAQNPPATSRHSRQQENVWVRYYKRTRPQSAAGDVGGPGGSVPVHVSFGVTHGAGAARGPGSQTKTPWRSGRRLASSQRQRVFPHSRGEAAGAQLCGSRRR